jgi:hypothetical protein
MFNDHFLEERLMKTSEVKQIIKQILGKHLSASPLDLTSLLARAPD